MHRKIKTSNEYTDYAIGDVHGCLDELKIALAWCSEDALSQNTKGRVHLLGDYIDRGPNSKEVIELLMQGSQEKHMKWLPIKGNHDDMLVQSWLDPSSSISAAWWEHGGQQTLRSYGWTPLYNEIPDSLGEWIPEEHIRFLENLPLSTETDTHIFVHAGMRPGIELEDQNTRDLMWIRGEFYNSNFDFGKPVVFGHTPDKANPKQYNNRIAMDSGCFGSGVLSIAAIDAHSLHIRFQKITNDIDIENNQSLSL